MRLPATAPHPGTRRHTALAGASAVLVSLLTVLSACGPTGRPTAAVTPAAVATPDISATIAAAVQATVQAQPVPAPAAGVPQLTSVLDESFGTTPQGWPNQPGGTAWYTDGAYRLQPQKAGFFVAVDAPLTNTYDDVVVSARFHKVGGPPGGGYGLVVADQGPDPHDGVNQGGRFVALEAGDQGTIGAWQHEEDRWIDLQPWTPNAVVHEGTEVNELVVGVKGQQLTFSVNGTQVAQVTMKLAAGRVGVFVGGDGNQVALEHFTVQTAITPSRLPASVTPTSVPASHAPGEVPVGVVAGQVVYGTRTAAPVTPTPIPSTPTPVPPTATSAPRTDYKLALLSGSCEQTAESFMECNGSVKNLTDRAIQNLEVVISWADAAGTTQRADEAVVNFNPLLAGQESPWRTIGTYNPALTRFRVQFKELFGGTISYRDDRPAH